MLRVCPSCNIDTGTINPNVAVFARDDVVKGLLNVDMSSVNSLRVFEMDSKWQLTTKDKSRSPPPSVGYLIFEGFDSSGRRNIGKQLVAVIQSIRELVVRLIVLAPSITRAERKLCLFELSNENLADVDVIDPLASDAADVIDPRVRAFARLF